MVVDEDPALRLEINVLGSQDQTLVFPKSSTGPFLAQCVSQGRSGVAVGRHVPAPRQECTGSGSREDRAGNAAKPSTICMWYRWC
jgi:hypothetical protein